MGDAVVPLVYHLPLLATVACHRGNVLAAIQKVFLSDRWMCLPTSPRPYYCPRAVFLFFIILYLPDISTADRLAAMGISISFLLRS